MLVIGLPQTPSAKGSLPGMTIWPLAALALIIFAARRAVPGWERAIFVLTALAVTTVCWLMFAVGMMAP